jgi:hypothetical protein
MNDQEWSRIYHEAVLELDAARLKGRIDAALAAIKERFTELQPAGNHADERKSLRDAQQTLEVLQRKEPKPR